jgi:molybdenum cofactor cytidylyltransferase
METIPGPREGHTFDRLWSIVLAAGAGSRFGGDKLRAPWGEGRLIDASLAATRAAPMAGVVVVTRPGDRLVEASDVLVVEAADWVEGMAASLRAGIAALPRDAAGVFLFLGDMPRVPHALLPMLAEALEAGAQAAAPTFAGRMGHPVAFSAALFSELLALAGDRGARSVLDRLGDRLVLVPAPDDGVLYDIDRPADLPVA